MKRNLLFGLSTALLFGLISSTSAQKKLDPKKYVKLSPIQGEVVSTSNNQSLRVKITRVTRTLNQGAYRALQRAQLDYRRAQARRDVNGMRNAQRSIAQNSRNLYQTKTTSQEITIEQAPNMKVRLKQPKPQFTDMGEIKELTKKELAKLRGKDGLFDGEWADIQTKQQVYVNLVRERTPVKKGEIQNTTLLATRIVVLTQAPPQ